MEFKDLKVGDKVDIATTKGSSYKRNYKRVRERTEIISVKGVRIKQVQVKYRKMWYRESDFGKWINNAGAELSGLRRG